MIGGLHWIRCLTSVLGGGIFEEVLSIGKLFLNEHFIWNLDDLSVFIPMYSSLVFPTAACRETASSAETSFLLWDASEAIQYTQLNLLLLRESYSVHASCLTVIVRSLYLFDGIFWASSFGFSWLFCSYCRTWTVNHALSVYCS